MNPTPVLRFGLFAVALLSSLIPRLSAQNIVLGEYKGKVYQVISARHQFPEVEVAGKRVYADERRLGLKKVDEYLPALISIHGLKVSTHHLNVGASQINNEFRFHARFETAYDLPNVVLVLELNHDMKEGKQLFLYEVGDLGPRATKSLDLAVPLSFSVGKGKFKIHLFTNGAEVLHTEMPEERRVAALDKLIKKQIMNVQDAEPAPFFGPVPEYPSSLLKAKTKGQAILTIQVAANGGVSDPVVKSATEPAFGASALEAVRQWRFLPKVTKGQAVASQLEMPFNFSPPDKS